ncbi:scarecrow-like protein 9 [Ananas comosus]|uniref:Scarecrow-like protein 9 n=1 Tax=Ananas comosus TaxID=4615 RepID=A0A6P5HAB5_ANACO|nr:scarecrow-like protein 9 [Ananas comosus]XP_020113581.1 scarecrow-like protein 9 [Ananas comosus]
MVMGDYRGVVSGFDYDLPFSHQFAMNNGFDYDDLQHIVPQSTFFDHNPAPVLSTPVSQTPNPPAAASGPQVDPSDDSEIFSDIVLSYIGRMLMEEDIDEKFDQYPEHPALLAAEKPFLEILGEQLPPSPDQPPLYSNSESPNDSSSNTNGNLNGVGSGGFVVDNSSNNNTWPYDPVEYYELQTHPLFIDYSSQSSFSSTNSNGNPLEGLEETLLSTNPVPDLLIQTQPALQFQRGLEEASRFLPDENKLVIDLEANGFYLPAEIKQESRTKLVEVKAEKEEYSIHRGKKHLHSEDLEFEEGRSNKQSAIYTEEAVREMFDKVLLCNGETCSKGVKELREALRSEATKHSPSNGSHSKGSGNGKGRRKKHSKKEVVDLRTLLIHCAQAVATDDRRSAMELLKQIRQHSSPKGDANERLAECFANGLEARLAGTGSQIYQSLVAKRTPVPDILKAYQLYMAASPFKKVSHFFSNQTILNAAEKAKTVHIIDYGIYYGFQWPCLMQRLSSRPGGPPKLRITAIDLPQPGFRPAERIEETGRRLADYARTFKVPFEYHLIAASWDTIRIEDLNINKDEVLIVNCLYRFRNLLDETVTVDCPRNAVLNTIRKMNPDVFIHGIVNGSYSAPFFVTRFREALFFFSALFDMLETNVPKEDEQRLLIERDLFGREALNVISCEGTERVERPETYKQWQVRTLRAGFKQLPLNGDIVRKATDKVTSCYHKDFVIDQDNRWLLLGWKGRIIYALSTWKSNTAS